MASTVLFKVGNAHCSFIMVDWSTLILWGKGHLEVLEQQPKSDKSATSYLSQKQKQFCFTQVSEIEVFLLLESLDTNKSFGIDKIHPLLLKTAALQIYRPLTFIFNLSINQGIFPDSMKLAKVVPVFKQGSRFACSNYQPISVLSSISKIIEMYF